MVSVKVSISLSQGDLFVCPGHTSSITMKIIGVNSIAEMLVFQVSNLVGKIWNFFFYKKSLIIKKIENYENFSYRVYPYP